MNIDPGRATRDSDVRVGGNVAGRGAGRVAATNLKINYQAMQFCMDGAHFQWETCHHKACVQMMLDTAVNCLVQADYACFKRAVKSGCSKDLNPR